MALVVTFTPEEAARFRVRLRPTSSGCILFVGSSSRYGQVRIRGKLYLAHRVAFQLAGGQTTEENPCVLHSCDNPLCCNPNHLRAGTQRTNMHDRTKRFRAQRGAAYPPGVFRQRGGGFGAYTDIDGRQHHGTYADWRVAAATAAYEKNLLLYPGPGLARRRK